MPAYHSTISADGVNFIANFPLLPLKHTCKIGGGRGFAPECHEDFDIVDESLDLFKESDQAHTELFIETHPEVVDQRNINRSRDKFCGVKIYVFSINHF